MLIGATIYLAVRLQRCLGLTIRFIKGAFFIHMKNCTASVCLVGDAYGLVLLSYIVFTL